MRLSRRARRSIGGSRRRESSSGQLKRVGVDKAIDRECAQPASHRKDALLISESYGCNDNSNLREFTDRCGKSRFTSTTGLIAGPSTAALTCPAKAYQS